MSRFTFPVRFLLWLFTEPKACEARITYYAHRVGERRAAP